MSTVLRVLYSTPQTATSRLVIGQPAAYYVEGAFNAVIFTISYAENATSRIRLFFRKKNIAGFLRWTRTVSLRWHRENRGATVDFRSHFRLHRVSLLSPLLPCGVGVTPLHHPASSFVYPPGDAVTRADHNEEKLDDAVLDESQNDDRPAEGSDWTGWQQRWHS